jgi:hypothetical protein
MANTEVTMPSDGSPSTVAHAGPSALIGTGEASATALKWSASVV